MSDNFWIDRAQGAEAQLAALRNQMEPLKAKVRAVKDALCAKENGDGTFTIDFAELVKKLGPDGIRELRAAMGEAEVESPVPDVLAQLVGKTVTIVAGGNGAKPKIRVHAKPGA